MYNIYIQHPGANGPASEATVLVRRGQGRGRGRDERRAERSPAAVREKVLRGRARHTRPRPERRSLHARGPQEVGGAHTAGPASGSTRPGPPREEESVPPQDGVHRGVHGALRDECEAQGLRVNLAGPTALIQSTRAIKSTSECMAAPSQTPDESKRRLRRLSRLLRSRGNPQCMGNPSAHARTPRQAHALPRRAPLAAPLANRPRRALRE